MMFSRKLNWVVPLMSGMVFVFVSISSVPARAGQSQAAESRQDAGGTTPGEKIEPQILADLEQHGKTTFFVVMTEQADTSAAVPLISGIADRAAQGQLVFNLLQEVATRTQQPILELLAETDAEATSFWIVNTIQVVTRDAALIYELAARPDVAYLKADVEWRIPEPMPGVEEPTIQAVEWGVARVRAPEVWQQFGVRGEGIVVANIDTGVQHTHPALVLKYRGRNPDGTFNHNYNWHDPSRVCPAGTPCDNNSHGTHTMGTMVGDDGGTNQIGVAPGATWIAAKGCESSSCSTGALLSSGQWVLAPTDLNGQNPRPDLRPHVVNNSWGGGPTDPFYRATVQNWVNAGVFPAFASGNPGSGCGRAGIPGVYPESFAVGATNSSDNIAGFSGRGPAGSFGGVIKPNVSAPGVNVRSSVPGNGYRAFDGTSMATPHVAGVVALVWSASPAMTRDIAGTIDLLQNLARPRLDAQCGAPGPPNNVYGWGIVDAFAAVEQAISGGTLEGWVGDSSTGEPVAGAEVQAVGPVTRTAPTNQEGMYRLRLTPGTYTVTARGGFGYGSQTVTNVPIAEGQTTTRDFSVPPMPRYWVWGSVWSNEDGAPLANVEVRLLGTPLPPARTDATGYYEFPGTVPEGTYDLQSGTPRCLMAQTRRINVTADREENFALDRRVDAGGYTCDDNVPFNWTPGTNLLGLTGDDRSMAVPLPFSFSFYGTTYQTAHVSTNGLINFLGPNTTYTNVCIPNSRAPNGMIAALWDDLLVNRPAGIYTKVEGAAPNRRFIIEWRDVRFYGRGASNVATFEMILEESAGGVTLQYNRTDGDGSGASSTIGTENQSGTIGLQFSCNEASVVNVGKAVRYFPMQ